MNIRSATHRDLDTILEMYNDAIAHSTAVYEYEPFSQDYIQHWFNEKLKNDHPILVAEENSNVVGFSTFGPFRTRAAYKTTAEHSVYVKKTSQGQGIGKRLVLAIIEEAKKRKVHALIGGIDSTNEESIAFHEKLGFVQVGKLPEVAFKFDKWLDLVFVQKIL